MEIIVEDTERQEALFFPPGSFQTWLHCLCATVHKDSYAVWTPSGSPPNGGLMRFIFSFEGGDYVSLPVSFCQLYKLLMLKLYRLSSQKLKLRVMWKAEGSGWEREGEGKQRGRRETEREWEREWEKRKGAEWRVQLFSGVARNCRVVGPTRGGGWVWDRLVMLA